MPTTYTHYQFGEEVLKKLPKPQRESIQKHRELFDIGVHGPDILFYYPSLKSNPVTKIGIDLHGRPGRAFFHRASAVLGKIPQAAAARTYIYGVICHFVLDSECHKYVEKMIQVSGISHHEIEMEFDRFLLSAAGVDPITYPRHCHVVPSFGNARIIAPFYYTGERRLTAREVQKSLQGMILVHLLLTAKKPTKRACLYKLMKLAGKYDELHGLIVSAYANSACQEYNLLLKRRYDEAVSIAAELIVEYQQVLFENGTLSKRFDETFDQGEHWQDLVLE